MKEYTVKLGRGEQTWHSEYDFVVPVAKDLGLCGASPSIETALDNSAGSPRLEELARGARSIVICVPDVTRGWCDAPKMNAAVRRRIAAAQPGASVTWIVATGQHREVLEGDKELVFGDALAAGDTWISHDCDKAVDLGLVTPTGTPVTVNPAFAAADLVVLVGGIIYHDMAGYAGGRKMIIPGVSGRRSIVINHNHCLIDGQLNPATDTGLLEGNPMAEDQHAFADLALRGKKCFLLNTIADKFGAPAAWVAGSLWPAWETGCRACHSLDSIYIPQKAKRCITSCGGYPFDLDLYQGTKALFSPLGAMEKNAPVVLVADLEDSLGPGDFEESLLWSLRDAAGFAEYMKEKFTIPGYIALRCVLEMRGRPAALVTTRPGVPFPGEVFRTVQEADAWLVEKSGTDGLSMLVPSGNAIHVLVDGPNA